MMIYYSYSNKCDLPDKTNKVHAKTTSTKNWQKRTLVSASKIKNKLVQYFACLCQGLLLRVYKAKQLLC